MNTRHWSSAARALVRRVARSVVRGSAAFGLLMSLASPAGAQVAQPGGGIPATGATVADVLNRPGEFAAAPVVVTGQLGQCLAPGAFTIRSEETNQPLLVLRFGPEALAPYLQPFGGLEGFVRTFPSALGRLVQPGFPAATSPGVGPTQFATSPSGFGAVLGQDLGPVAGGAGFGAVGSLTGRGGFAQPGTASASLGANVTTGGVAGLGSGSALGGLHQGLGAGVAGTGVAGGGLAAAGGRVGVGTGILDPLGGPLNDVLGPCGGFLGLDTLGAALSTFNPQVRVRVTGLVRRFNEPTVEQAAGADLPDAVFEPFAGEPALVAVQVTPFSAGGAAAVTGAALPAAQAVPTGPTTVQSFQAFPAGPVARFQVATAEEVTDNPMAYLGRIVTVIGNVSDCLREVPGAFVLEDDDWFMSEEVLVLRPSPDVIDRLVSPVGGFRGLLTGEIPADAVVPGPLPVPSSLGVRQEATGPAGGGQVGVLGQGPGGVGQGPAAGIGTTIGPIVPGGVGLGAGPTPTQIPGFGLAAQLPGGTFGLTGACGGFLGFPVANQSLTGAVEAAGVIRNDPFASPQAVGAFDEGVPIAVTGIVRVFALRDLEDLFGFGFGVQGDDSGVANQFTGQGFLGFDEFRIHNNSQRILGKFERKVVVIAFSAQPASVFQGMLGDRSD